MCKITYILLFFSELLMRELPFITFSVWCVCLYQISYKHVWIIIILLSFQEVIEVFLFDISHNILNNF